MSNHVDHPTVSVIVPVYNAEKYLGYCLNSIVSQTYPELEAILVNDGSTDSSLSICEQYAQADKRFKVISIPNGGVSNARNTALAAATGDYYVFLDSDDILALDALELMLDAEKQYHTGLVMGNIQLVDFSTEKLLPIRLCSDYTGEKALFSKEEFAAKKMELVWHTSMLEGLYGKLYDAKIWRASGTHCPTELSLGEDFVANMNYYDACNGVYFLKHTTYYYNNIESSGSLTHKYRDDLFDTKMYLMRKLLTHLGGMEALEAYQRRCYCEHVTMTGLRCIEDVRNENDHLSLLDKEKTIQHILGDNLFRQCVAEAEYVDERLKPMVPFVIDQNAHALLDMHTQPIVAAPQLGAEEAVLPDRRCFLNKAMGKIIRAVGNHYKERPAGQKMLRFDETLRSVGIRNTMHQYSRKERRKNALLADQQSMVKVLIEQSNEKSQCQTEAVRLDIQGTLNSLRQQNAAEHGKLEAACFDLQGTLNSLRQQNAAEHGKLEAACFDLQGTLNRISERIIEQNEQQTAVINNGLNKLSECSGEAIHQLWKAAQDVKDRIYLGEQRVQSDLIRNRINELRQKKKLLLIGTPEHCNIGDAAIALAEQYLLQTLYPDLFQLEFSTYEMAKNYSFLQAIIRPDDLICLHGGGNLGSLYPIEEDLRRQIISDFPEHKIIILPQTIFFTNDAHGKKELQLSAKIYNAHRNLTLFVRGNESLAFAQKHFANVKTHLMPDTAFYLKRDYSFDREGILLCMRDDDEGVYSAEQKCSIEAVLRAVDAHVDIVENMADHDISREERASVVNTQLKRFAQHRLVVTDRLHGAIFAVITKTPCVVLGIGNQKIREFIHTFLSDCNAVCYIGSELKRLPEAAADMYNVAELWSIDLDLQQFLMIRTDKKNTIDKEA